MRTPEQKPHRRLIRTLTAAVAALSVTVALAACQGGTPSAEEEMPTLRVAYAQGLQANFYYALQNGIFEEHGVKVIGTKFDSGPALVSALVAGSADVGYFGAPAMVTANAGGADLQIFGVANEAGSMAALYVNPDSGIDSIEDVRGRTIATTQNTVAHIFLLIALEQAGIDASEVDIQFFDPAGLVAGYARGDLDAISMFASVGAKLMSEGASLIESTSSQALGLDDTGNFIADATFVQENMATLERFLAAVDEASPITNGSKEAYLTALEQGIGLVGDQAEIIYANSPSPNLVTAQLADPDFRLALTPGGGFTKILQEMVDTMLNLGIITEAPDVSSLVTSEVVERMNP